MHLKKYLEENGHGSAAELARSLGVSHVLISQWANNVRPLPSLRALQIEAATNGALRVEDLRPDVSWVRVPDRAWRGRGRPVLDLEKLKA